MNPSFNLLVTKVNACACREYIYGCIPTVKGRIRIFKEREAIATVTRRVVSTKGPDRKRPHISTLERHNVCNYSLCYAQPNGETAIHMYKGQQ